MSPPNSPTQSMTTTGNNNRRLTKRRHRVVAPQLSYEQQQLSYCQRLVHQCRKDLHKQAKVCKNLNCQKLIRTFHKESAAAAATNSRSADHDQKLQQWRELSLELVVNECFRRLGVLDLLEMIESSSLQGDDDANFNPQTDAKQVKGAAQQKINGSSHDPVGDASSNSSLRMTTKSQQQASIERVLQHKRMRQAIEKWSLQVTEYRKWCNRNDVSSSSSLADDNDNDSQDGFLAQDDTKGRKKRKRPKSTTTTTTTSRRPDAEEIVATASHSLFTTLGSDNNADNNQGGDEQQPTKKNRAGQKARRAKAQAEDAAARGRQGPDYESANWRPVRDKRRSEHRRGQQPPFKVAPPAARPNHQEEPLHPSWEARKTQKPNIVAFQGKKITFD